MKAVILKGIPACGKSTLAKEYIDKGYLCINGDNLRLMNPDLKEKEIQLLQARIAQDAYGGGIDIVWDNTHMNIKTLNKTVDYCMSLGYDVEVVDVFGELIRDLGGEINAINECIARNHKREARVPQSVIYEMYLKGGYKLSEKKLIIVDLDGTLYNIEHRLKYARGEEKNWHMFESNNEIKKDKVHVPLRDLLQALSYKYGILYVSGRKNTACDVTIENLIRDDLDGVGLLMRNSWDNRKDNEVKQDFLDIIKKNHDILMVIDDRKQVIDMWKENGLYVLNACQLDNNDF